MSGPVGQLAVDEYGPALSPPPSASVFRLLQRSASRKPIHHFGGLAWPGLSWLRGLAFGSALQEIVILGSTFICGGVKGNPDHCLRKHLDPQGQ